MYVGKYNASFIVGRSRLPILAFDRTKAFEPFMQPMWPMWPMWQKTRTMRPEPIKLANNNKQIEWINKFMKERGHTNNSALLYKLFGLGCRQLIIILQQIICNHHSHPQPKSIPSVLVIFHWITPTVILFSYSLLLFFSLFSSPQTISHILNVARSLSVEPVIPLWLL